MSNSPKGKLIFSLLLITALFVCVSGSASASENKGTAYQHWLKARSSSGFSSMGEVARMVRQARASRPNGGAGTSFRVASSGANIPNIPNLKHAPDPASKPDLCFGGDEDCSEEGFSDNGPGAAQSEMSVAVDTGGTNIVVGYNDFRGFNFAPTSLSGFAYSNDGGKTFTDGGQLPTTAAAGQVFGDPSVLYVPGGGGCQFVYFSIFVTAAAQTMSVHSSTDCGHTWNGPFVVTPATQPTSAGDAADKELGAIDPDTGRVLMSWSNFTNTGVEIRTTYSDNIMATPPTWSTGVVLNPTTAKINFDTGSVPAMAGYGSNRAMVAWSDQDSFYTASTMVAVSNDNGQTFGPPVTLDQSPLLLPNFFVDMIIGNDRIHQFPAAAIDKHGNLHVAYATNGNLDGADVVTQRSTDGGLTWSEPTDLSSRPGNDRSQWFPAMTADQISGRIWVTYDDQGVDPSGDRMEMIALYSDDDGVTWSKPFPLTSRPFHAGYGNDTSQPNLGDYNASVSQNGFLYTVYPVTPYEAFYTDGEPAISSFTYPSFLGNATAGGTAVAPGFVKTNRSVPSLRLGNVTFKDSGGNGIVDAGDVVAFKFPITNFVTNPATSPGPYQGALGTLTTSTPGVSILFGISPYATVDPGATNTNILDYFVYLGPNFVPGTDIDFTLNVQTRQGSAKLLYTQSTGTPVTTTLFSENFDEVAPGSLPTGWATSHGGGANVVPWTTNNTFCGTKTNAAFHQNANDNGTGNPRRFERLFSTPFTVPANAQIVTLDMDICYDTEDDPLYDVLGYDGFTLRITDMTSGHILRSVFPEAYVTNFTTGDSLSFPKHFPRSSSSAYFQDISAWSGSSGGRFFDPVSGLFLHNPPKVQHVHMELPGMAGTTAQLRFEFTQDTGGICTDVGGGPVCGVQVDNIVIRSGTKKSDELAYINLRKTGNNTWAGFVVSQAAAGPGGIPVTLSSDHPSQVKFSTTNLVIPAGSNQSPNFTLTRSGSSAGVKITITATGPSNSRSATF